MVIAQQKFIPALRFLEFAEEWEYKQIGSICEIKTGDKDTKNKVTDGNFPFFVRSDNVERIDTYSYDGEAILTSGDGVGVGKNFHYYKGKFDFHQRVYCLRNFKQSVSGRFIYEIFSERFFRRVIRLSAKNSVDSVRIEMIAKMEIAVPSIYEQQKIAAFLSSVDTKIEQLSKKKSLLEQYKKGVMQKLFSQEIRFKDDQGNDYPSWKSNVIGALFVVSAGGDIEKVHSRSIKDDIFCYPVYANSEKAKGLHSYSDQYRIDQDCITVSGRGTLGVAHARFEKFFPIVRLLVLIPKEECDLIFFEHAVNVVHIFNESTGVPQLTAPQLTKYRLDYPIVQEQQKIANFLSIIDKKIELVVEQIKQIQAFKKGLLQQMFV